MDKRNLDVYLNFGLICYGPLSEIIKLQELIEKECKRLKVRYQTVTAKRLWLVKRVGMWDGGEEGKRGGER